MHNIYKKNNDVKLSLDYYYTEKNGSKIYSSYIQDLRSGKQNWNDYNFKHSDNEIITVTMDATLYGKTGESYSKSLSYVLYPKTKVEYFDFLTDLF